MDVLALYSVNTSNLDGMKKIVEKIYDLCVFATSLAEPNLHQCFIVAECQRAEKQTLGFC